MAAIRYYCSLKENYMNRLFSFLIILAIPFVSIAQQPLSLEKAIQIARENSLRIKQSQLGVSQSEVDLAQSRQARFPTLNLSSGFQYNLGRSVNPVTYEFETTEFSYTNLGINSGVTLSSGNRINASIHQAKLALQSAQESLFQEADNIGLEVALGFLNVVFAQENLANAKAQLRTSQDQLDLILKSIEAGAAPTNDRYELDAQVALREQNVTAQENTLRLAKLNLQQLLLWEDATPIEIERPNIEALVATLPGSLDADQIFQQALQYRHDILSAKWNSEAAQKGIDIAKAGYWPTLTFGLGGGSGFTDNARAPSNFQTLLTPVPGVFIDGEAVDFRTEQLVPTDFEQISLADQLDQNMSWGLQVNLSIPIYNRRNVKSAVERAQIGHEMALVQEQSVKQTLRQNIEQAVADFKASRDNLAAQRKTVESLEAAYNAAKRRYDIGQGNSFELATAKNNLDASINQLTIARYDYVFKLKVIDFYLGRGLTL